MKVHVSDILGGGGGIYVSVVSLLDKFSTSLLVSLPFISIATNNKIKT